MECHPGRGSECGCVALSMGGLRMELESAAARALNLEEKVNALALT